MSTNDDRDDHGTLNKEVDPSLGTSNNFKTDSASVASSQGMLIGGFGLLFFLCLCCVGRRIYAPTASARRDLDLQVEEEEEDDEETMARRMKFIKKRLNTVKWEGGGGNNTEEGATTRGGSTADGTMVKESSNDVVEEESSPLSSRLTSVLHASINSITTTLTTTSEDERDSTCSICLNDYVDGTVVAYSSHPDCTHKFHEECITSWLLLKRKSQCPLCRTSFLMEEKEEDGRLVREEIDVEELGEEGQQSGEEREDNVEDLEHQELCGLVRREVGRDEIIGDSSLGEEDGEIEC